MRVEKNSIKYQVSSEEKIKKVARCEIKYKIQDVGCKCKDKMVFRRDCFSRFTPSQLICVIINKKRDIKQKD